MGPDAMSDVTYEVTLTFPDGEEAEAEPLPTEHDLREYLYMLRDIDADSSVGFAIPDRVKVVRL
jgi:hypothetical protein